ncbi:MAG: hypothetical protein E7575_05240, partial [Ruminococcaceae bacterium]|nr:hypothetical protein [Oscillospiraceae bacterium]
MRKKYYNNKKKKFYVLQSAVTVLVVILVIFMNAGVSALVNHFGWRIDMTKGQVFTLSDKTKEYMKSAKGDVNIYFAVESDKIAETAPALYYIYQTALQLEAKFDSVNVECVDIIKNPNHFRGYLTTDLDEIHTTDVVIDSGADFRVYTMESFFVYNDYGEVWAYNGEQKFVSAILSVTSTEKPVVCFTTKHGETVGDGASALVSLFSDAGFEVKAVDLSSEDLPEDTRIVIINDPKYDFAGFESETGNEIEKLDNFLDDFGFLMVFADPDHSSNLTRLNEFLSEWGIAMNGATFLKDSAHSVTVDHQSILCSYAEDSLGASLYTDLSASDTMPDTIVRKAMPIDILWQSGVKESLSGTREISPVLLSHDTAVKVSDGKEGESGSFPLMTVTRENRVINNEYYYSYVLACGSAHYTSNSFLNDNKYANNDIIYNAMRIMGRDSVIADIDFKVFDDTSLTITTKDANFWSVLLTVLPPVVFALCGTVVCVRRKNS